MITQLKQSIVSAIRLASAAHSFPHGGAASWGLMLMAETRSTTVSGRWSRIRWDIRFILRDIAS